VSRRKTIHLNAFDMTCVGHQSPGLWRHPDDQSYRCHDLGYWTDLAKLLEKGLFDSLFIADVLGVYDVYQGSAGAAIREAAQISRQAGALERRTWMNSRIQDG
jgi:alkanesulfonate monooxygenase SsuD/methylene tetrahydromethanopterin reductase-like flavin-dependent oxidoreductase (luciferase family)